MARNEPEVRHAEALARMMRVGEGNERTWQEDELQEVLAHQLTAPVAFEPVAPGAAPYPITQVPAAAQGLLIHSFADLLLHAAPPLDLLRQTKDFAKACHSHTESVLPREIALALYLASIAAARVRCRERITELNDTDLLQSTEWALRQPWMDNRLLPLLREMRRCLSNDLRAT